jgi:hypothetical protein
VIFSRKLVKTSGDGQTIHYQLASGEVREALKMIFCIAASSPLCAIAKFDLNDWDMKEDYVCA